MLGEVCYNTMMLESVCYNNILEFVCYDYKNMSEVHPDDISFIVYPEIAPACIKQHAERVRINNDGFAYQSEGIVVALGCDDFVYKSIITNKGTKDYCYDPLQATYYSISEAALKGCEGSKPITAYHNHHGIGCSKFNEDESSLGSQNYCLSNSFIYLILGAFSWGLNMGQVAIELAQPLVLEPLPRASDFVRSIYAARVGA